MAALAPGDGQRSARRRAKGATACSSCLAAGVTFDDPLRTRPYRTQAPSLFGLKAADARPHEERNQAPSCSRLPSPQPRWALAMKKRIGKRRIILNGPCHIADACRRWFQPSPPAADRMASPAAVSHSIVRPKRWIDISLASSKQTEFERRADRLVIPDSEGLEIVFRFRRVV